VLLILSVPDRAALSLMARANPAMADRYRHVTNEIRKKIAQQIGRAI